MTAVLDPLAPGHRGWWECGEVLVCHEDGVAVPNALTARLVPSHVTAHFRVYALGRRTLVSHRYRGDELDDDLAGHLAVELDFLAGHFEELFTGVVRTTVHDPLLAWTVFYANTLAALRRPGPAGAIASFAPVHARALELVRGRTVLDLGSCFGFLPLQMVSRGLRPIASDVSAGTMGLLSRVSSWFGTPLPVLACDAAAVPLASRSVDTVTAIHLLEHVSPSHGAAVLREMLRVARRRVVVAVPFEATPNPAFGHVRCFDFEVLQAWGRASGVPFTVFEHHGGWLVLDVA
ncbi:SAM-dependent methyltransferase [Amycolatopsis sp. NBRC 101858]|uniref:mycofactocin oligosaccharide methyltransferase MftM n=1 Tax=Amycolatopsis sp. NBRC 101858 TaxID=3032200 RepID=UPI0024A273E3|nr:mycofactocin oligosaccharide methyltransferase MftM [Amycolatopsis sp. NBRC 101858]GLY36781.1 SAM-dependent methyltransferase [Amycolatopsis sp. NBRC 101858]